MGGGRKGNKRMERERRRESETGGFVQEIKLKSVEKERKREEKLLFMKLKIVIFLSLSFSTKQ